MVRSKLFPIVCLSTFPEPFTAPKLREAILEEGYSWYFLICVQRLLPCLEKLWQPYTYIIYIFVQIAAVAWSSLQYPWGKIKLTPNFYIFPCFNSRQNPKINKVCCSMAVSEFDRFLSAFNMLPKLLAKIAL